MSKDHFYFSRNDRVVAFVLLIIIISAKVALFCLPGKGGNLETIESDSIVALGVKERNRVDTTQRKTSYVRKSSQSYKRETVRVYKDTIKSQVSDTVRYKSYTSKKRPSQAVDLNSVDSLTLISLPGIGPYYSSRILRYREQLGGYVLLSQLMEINGLPDSVMEWFVITDTVPVRKILVNSETLTGLRKHPYINFYQARAITEYRRERGKIKGPNQLSLIDEFTDQDLVRLKPYLDFN